MTEENFKIAVNSCLVLMIFLPRWDEFDAFLLKKGNNLTTK